MRILLISVYYLPSTKSCAKLMHDLAAEFLQLGHEVIVLTPDNQLGSNLKVSDENGIEVVRIKAGKIDQAPKIIRAVNEIMLSAILWRKSREFFKKHRCDLVVWYSPSIFFGFLVKKLKQLFGCRSYLILRDIFPQWAVDAGILKKGLVYGYFRKKEMEQYGVADIIGVQSPANLDYFRENGLDKKHRLEVLYNWTKLKEDNIRFYGYRQQLGLNDKVVFFYGGNIGMAQDMNNILRLAESLKDEPKAYFLLVGDGSEAERLKTIIERKKLMNIVIHGAVDQERYLAMLSEFDVGLISLDRKLKTQNFPGKMLGYMYYSMPVLASVNPGNDLKIMLEEKCAGLVSFNGNDAQLREDALRLIKDLGLRRRLGANARLLLENTFSVSRSAGQILAHFQ